MSFSTSRIVALLMLLLFTSRSSGTAAEPVFPGRTWEQKPPAELKLNTEKLKAFSQFVGGRGCVIRHGYLAYSWGDVSRRADVASACKPLYSHLLFQAIEDGRLAGVDEAVARHEPRLGRINARLDHQDRLITWRQMANQTSCYQLTERPGAAFDYNDWQMALLFDTLFLKVYGATYDNVDEKVLRPLLTEPLECEDAPTLMAFGTGNRPGRVGISVRDFARFGLLYLHRGNWNGRQLISRERARRAVSSPLPNSIPRAGRQPAEMIAGQRSLGSGDQPDNQTDHFGSYSWLWWINGRDRAGTRMWPDAPPDTFGAFGHGGPRAMWVIPSLDVVVSYNDARLNGWHPGDSPTNRAMKLLVAACADHAPPAADHGSYGKWSKIELTFAGPASVGRGEPNPFSPPLDVRFTSPSGRRFDVPGFYDGDGRGSLDGNVWKVRFSADEAGDWTYLTASPDSRLDRRSGRFTVTSVPDNAVGLWKWGRLEKPGTAENRVRYLKFRDGPYWLKAGCDDPENFLGRYNHYDTPDERRAAIDYLAARGINSLYIMTHNIGGDDRDVWPWLGDAAAEAKANAGRNARFDVEKLEQWRELFEHMHRRGVVPYLVLEDDSAWNGFDRDRYYREIIARFGYLPALVFNLGEEHNENYSLAEGLAQARRLADIDPYDHPRGIHNVNRPRDDYIDAEHVDFTAIQTGSPGSHQSLENALSHNALALEWNDRCTARGRRFLMIGFDEGRPEGHRAAWWSAYLGGGVWEAHVQQPYDRPLSAWEPVWTELGGARRFMESLPFWRMEPHNELVTAGQAFCLALPGEAYALYLPTGNDVTLTLTESRTYQSAWWNPANGQNGRFSGQQNVRGGSQRFSPPGDGDWALRVVAENE